MRFFHFGVAATIHTTYIHTRLLTGESVPRASAHPYDVLARTRSLPLINERFNYELPRPVLSFQTILGKPLSLLDAHIFITYKYAPF